MQFIRQPKVLLLLQCLVAGAWPGGAEVFSSVARLKRLPLAERQLLEKVEGYLGSAPSDAVTDGLRGQTVKFQKTNSKTLKDVSVLECPVHAFRLVRRLVLEWTILCDLLTTPSRSLRAFANATREWIHSRRAWPTSLDLSGAAMALVRLRHVYGLEYTSFLRGRVMGMTSQPMTSSEVSIVARAALDGGLLCEARDLLSAWDSVARSSCEDGGGCSLENEGIELRRLREELTNASTGAAPLCRNISGATPSTDPVDSSRDPNPGGPVQHLYHRLCRHTLQTSVVYGSGRRCFLQPTVIPYLKFKAEVVNSDPLLVLFHDVISDEEIQEFKRLSFKKFIPSALAVNEVIHERLLVRVSQTAWLFDSTPVVSRVSRRVHLVTGLSTRILPEATHAEPYQVVNYGIGGMNGLHEDSVRLARGSEYESAPSLHTAGDRTATWMYYLSDVQLGGATVFPLLGAGIRPKKGCAVLWYNLRRHGAADTRIVHAGCPVLRGDKWVANKWLREAGSVFTRPCSLDPAL